MKQFYCYRCEEYSRTGYAKILRETVFDLRVDANGFVTGYSNRVLHPKEIPVSKMECGCGAILTIKEEPCDHRWGRETYGYGNAEGQIKRVCLDCGKIEFGKGVRPVWD